MSGARRRRVACRRAPRALLAAALALAAVLALAARAAAQPVAPPRVTLGAGLSLTSPLLVDGNGTTVRVGVAPYVSAALAPAGLRRGRAAFGVGARLGAGALRLRAPDARWRAGTAWQVDALLRAELGVAQGVALRAGIGGTWLAGPRDVAPLDRARGVRPAAEAGVVVRPRAARLALHAALQGYRVRPAGGAAGGVARGLLGVTYAP